MLKKKTSQKPLLGYIEKINQLQEELEGVARELSFLIGKRDELLSEINFCKTDLKNTNLKIKDYNKKLDKIKIGYNNLIETYKGKKEDFDASLDGYAELVDNYKLKITELEKKEKNLSHTVGKLEEYKKELDKASEELSDKKQELSKLEANTKKESRKLGKLRQKQLKELPQLEKTRNYNESIMLKLEAHKNTIQKLIENNNLNFTIEDLINESQRQ